MALLKGDPRTAIRRLSGPLIISMLLLSAFNIVDAIWVAGLGEEALAAVGLAFPLYMIMVGCGEGLGVGVGTAIARRIGRNDRDEADGAAAQGMLLAALLAVVFTLSVLLFSDTIFGLFGEGEAAVLAAEYATIIFGASTIVFFSELAYGVLKGEGDTGRVMQVIVAAEVINFLLDPVLIYGAGMGVAGAAWATVISLVVEFLVMIFWFVVRKDTYVTLSLRRTPVRWPVVSEIVRVSIPNTLGCFLVSGTVVVINAILTSIAGDAAIAVYTSGWRVVTFALVPLFAISSAVMMVAGAAVGARLYQRVEEVFRYAVRLGVGIGVLMSVGVFLFAPQITLIFTYSEACAAIAPEIVAFLRTVCLFFPAVPLGVMAGAFFMASGRGTASLIVTSLGVGMVGGLAYLFGNVMGLGVDGVWWGIVVGEVLGNAAGFLWMRHDLETLAVRREEREYAATAGRSPSARTAAPARQSDL
ncbi:MATE family efflux transporter [Methanofollis formosanus]|uniref:Multidrug-efflux transporter n=1 Tax=Methanofollis formosanus TaxID=299308 RepID=A0A8G1EFI0_9EURY|nr:MATE family efflux transporter [Methanofollis formosanus]QYZ78151.1 MATE family efflux transporter [Methanofollis formosanus]